MGPATDPTAVVSPRLQVHGVTRLRVIDASIMPNIVSGNINAPVIMIAEKGSDLIKEDWGWLAYDGGQNEGEKRVQDQYESVVHHFSNSPML